MVSNSKRGHTRMQWVCALIVDLGFLIYGMEMGWMSPITKVLQSEESPLGEPMTDTMVSLVASVLGFVAAVAVPIYSYLANKYGRKWVVFATTVPQLISVLLKIFLPNVTVLCIARAANGLSAGGTFVVGPMYIREISQPELTGTLGYTQVVLQNVGFLIMYLLGAYCNYFTVLWITSVFPLVMALLMFKAPESPAYLVKLGKIEEARETVALLRGLKIDDKIVEGEVDYMRRQEEEFQLMTKLDYINILKDKGWRRAFIFIMLIFTAHSWNGAFAIITYSSAILASSGVQYDISPKLQSVSCPVVMLLASTILTAAVDRCRRKFFLGSTHLISALSQSALGVAMLLQTLGYPVPGWVPITCMVITVSMYAGGVRPLPFIILTELFSFQVRAKMMGLVVSYAWGATAFCLFCFTPLSAVFGLHGAFIFYGLCNLLGVLFTIFLPETGGKSDDEIRLQLTKEPNKLTHA